MCFGDIIDTRCLRQYQLPAGVALPQLAPVLSRGRIYKRAKRGICMLYLAQKIINIHVGTGVTRRNVHGPFQKQIELFNRFGRIKRMAANANVSLCVKARLLCFTKRFGEVAYGTRCLSTAMAQVKEQLDSELQDIRSAGTWKRERVITTKQDISVGIQGNRKTLLNFCANNYLGLSSHPEVIKAGQDALAKYGAGVSSVRFICGTQDIHKELEERIAKFHGRDDAIVYASCFDANAGIFEILLSPEDAVLSDELNHASIIDGIRLCKAKKFRYLHKNVQDLEAKLKEANQVGARRKLIVTDGVFSMDGNVAPLSDIKVLADRYNAMIFIDECHATGFFGKTGRGKALGGAAGGYTTGPKQLIDLLRQRSRPYLFSNSLPPPVVACAIKVFELLETTNLTQKVAENTALFRQEMTRAGFTILGENHPICPVLLGDAKLASMFADKMMDEGIYVIGFSYPVVPKGKARIRVQLSAAHDTEDIKRTVQAFTKIGRELSVIK